MKFYALFIGVFCFALNVSAQTRVHGIVTDAISGETMIGANVSYAPGKGASTNENGFYEFSIPAGDYTIETSYVGYTAVKKQIKVTGKDLVLDFQIESSQLNEVEIIADVALGRTTPVAFSDIPSIKIKEELGTRDLPLVLNTTPGVYATQSGGGDGDSRINIRGFSQRYVAVMVDGIPMNDMENGWVYWSNWFGLDAVTQKVQVQRGLGASKLAIPSVGGNINILTQGIDQVRSLVIGSEMGNNNNLRQSIGLNTGKMKGGWGVTGAFSFRKNDGWVENLRSRQLFYFIKIQKQFEKHSFSLSAMGSPQEHYQRPLRQQIHYYERDYAASLGVDVADYTGLNYGDFGVRHNQYWGVLSRTRNNPNAEEEILSERLNYYHKPIFNFKHFWTPNHNLALSNVVYASLGNGGGTALKTSVFDENGQTGFNQIYYDNTHGTLFVPAYDLAYVDDTSQYKSRNYMLSRVNNHFWIGLLSTFKWKFNEEWEFSGGIDARYYHTDRYQEMYDLLGGDYAVPNASGDDLNNPDDLVKREGDIFGYKIRSFVKQSGLFLLAEYRVARLSAFVNATVSLNQYNRINYFALKNPDGSYQSSGWKNMPGATIKSGMSYNFNSAHNVFVNAGYLSRSQNLNNVYNGTSLNVYSNLKNEEIIAAELGYLGTYKNGIKPTLNLYYTIWNNKPVTQSVQFGTDVYFVSVPGMNAHHRGVELEVEAKAGKKLTLEGVVSIGDWRWMSDATAIVTNEDGTVNIDTISFDAKGIRVGDAAQTQLSFAFRYEPIKGFYIKPRFTYFDQNYADFDPESLQGENGSRQSWRIPSYYLVDVNLGYRFDFSKKIGMTLKVNLMNVTDEIFISDARNNEYGNGFDAQSAGVYMGQGFRWNLGLSINFK